MRGVAWESGAHIHTLAGPHRRGKMIHWDARLEGTVVFPTPTTLSKRRLRSAPRREPNCRGLSLKLFDRSDEARV